MPVRRPFVILVTAIVMALGALSGCTSGSSGSGGGPDTIAPCPTRLNGRNDGNDAGENSGSDTTDPGPGAAGSNDGFAESDNCVGATKGYPAP